MTTQVVENNQRPPHRPRSGDQTGEVQHNYKQIGLLVPILNTSIDTGHQEIVIIFIFRHKQFFKES